MELFDFSQISVQDMLLVKAIAEHGSISQAAQVVGVSQPTASYRLNKLREIFADQIFTSVNRQMSPTIKGLRIVETFRTQIDHFSRLAAPEIFDPKTTKRSFTIIAKGFQFSALGALLPKVFFKETRFAKLFIEQGHGLMSINQQLSDRVDFLAQPYESQGAAGIRRLVSPALQMMIYFDADVRKAPKTMQDISECRFVMLNSLVSLPSIVDKLLLKNGFSARNIVAIAPTSTAIAEFIKGTDLVFIGSSFSSAIGDSALSHAEFPMKIPPIRHEIRWSISKEAEAGHAWLRNMLMSLKRADFKPSFQIDPGEQFIMLSEFEQIRSNIGPSTTLN